MSTELNDAESHEEKKDLEHENGEKEAEEGDSAKKVNGGNEEPRSDEERGDRDDSPARKKKKKKKSRRRSRSRDRSRDRSRRKRDRRDREKGEKGSENESEKIDEENVATGSPRSSSPKKKKRKRSRDRSKDRRRRSGSRDKDRRRGDRRGDRRSDRRSSRSRDRGGRRRRSSRSRSRGGRDDPPPRRPSPPPNRMRRSRSPFDPEKEALKRAQEEEAQRKRDENTVFVYQIHPKVHEKDLFDFFSAVGKVTDIRLIRDQRTHKSKGLCYIEFLEKSSVMKSLQLTGQLIGGYPITVTVTQSEKNHQRAPVAPSSTAMRLYVGSLHFNVTEEDLKPVFEAFGEVDFIDLHKDPATGTSRGFGFVQYKKSTDAKVAMMKLNGFEIAGRQIKVGMVEGEKPMGEGLVPPGPAASSMGHLDNNASGGIGMNANSRAQLMMNLSRGVGGAPPMGAGVAPAGMNPERAAMLGLQVGAAPPMPGMPPVGMPGMPMPGMPMPGMPMPGMIGMPMPGMPGMGLPQQAPPVAAAPQMIQATTCVIIRNMFDPRTEEDPEFHLDIKEDVEEECEKYGKVKHIFVDKDNPNGMVYLRLDNVETAKSVRGSLDGRWFASRQIKAEFCVESVYLMKFPQAK